MNWHTRTMAAMKRKTIAELYFIRKDALEASEALGELNPEKSGQYMDEHHYATMEIKRRQSV